jgi:hypothetical protein
MYRLDNNKPPGDVGTPNHGWVHSYKMLTTPISYMGSIIPDVFQATDVLVGSADHRIGGPNGPLSYDYGTDEFHGYDGNSSHPWYKAWRNSTWKIGSPGPDLQYLNQSFLSGWASGNAYDSTNGLTSAGDIFRGESYYSKSSKERGI